MGLQRCLPHIVYRPIQYVLLSVPRNTCLREHRGYLTARSFLPDAIDRGWLARTVCLHNESHTHCIRFDTFRASIQQRMWEPTMRTGVEGLENQSSWSVSTEALSSRCIGTGVAEHISQNRQQPDRRSCNELYECHHGHLRGAERGRSHSVPQEPLAVMVHPYLCCSAGVIEAKQDGFSTRRRTP